MKNSACFTLVFVFIIQSIQSAKAQTEVPILKVESAYIIEYKPPYAIIQVNIENDYKNYYSFISYPDSALVFLDKNERRQYEIKRQKAELERQKYNERKQKALGSTKAFTGKEPSLVDKTPYQQNRQLLRAGLEVEMAFYEYRYSKKFVMQEVTILTDLTGPATISGTYEQLDGDIATVGGQVVQLKAGTKLVGEKGYKGRSFGSFKNMEKGMELKLKGQRQTNGVLLVESGTVIPDEFTETDYKLLTTLRATKKMSLDGREVAFGNVKFNLLRDEQINAYISRVGQKLIPDHIKNLPRDHPAYVNFNFFVVIDTTFNACAYPDGSVFVHTQLLNEISNESQLAAVLAHEIAHVTYRHSRKEYERNQAMGFSKAMISSAMVSAYGIEATDLANSIAAFGGAALSSSYSRSLESQADRIGLNYIYEAGYEPREAPKLWQRLFQRTLDVPTKSFGERMLLQAGNTPNTSQERELAMATLKSNAIASIYASHPSAGKRYKALNSLIIQNYQDVDLDKLSTGEFEYKVMQKRLRRLVSGLPGDESEVESTSTKPVTGSTKTVAKPIKPLVKSSRPVQRSIRPRKTLVSPSDDSQGNTTELNEKANSYTMYGQYEKAASLYKESLTMLEKKLGKHHPDYLNQLNNLADLYAKTENYRQTAELIKETATMYRQRLLNDLGIEDDDDPSEQLQQTFNGADFAYSIALSTKVPQLGEVGFNRSLLAKGAQLLAYQQLQKLVQTNTDSTVRLLNNRQQSIRRQLRQLYDTNAGLDKTGPLEQQVQNIQKALLLLIPDYHKAYTALQVEWQHVQQHLKPDEAAIEFVHFRYWNKRWTDSTYYVALVIRPSWLTPKFVYLCEQRQLDSLLSTGGGERKADYVARLYGESNRGVKVSSVQGKSTHSLHELVWQPIDTLLTGVRKIFYSPSGSLHRLNLGAIALNARERLTNRFTLTLLSSTRQLALHPDTISYSNHALLLGNIRYNLDSTAYQKANATFPHPTFTNQSRVNQRTNGRGTIWQELDQTGPEIDTAAVMLKKAGFLIDTLQGWRASEEGFYHFTHTSQSVPRYIHIATHGYFEEDRPVAKSDIRLMARASSVDNGQSSLLRSANPNNTRSTNPLIRSGLILAGANHAWASGQHMIGHEDGILTAYEISLLDLRQTELVVLSACETGLGKIQGNEGVYGLQRALKMAGVKNIIMSLWKVDDVATFRLMESFYRHYLGDKDKPSIRQSFDKAVADTQRQYRSPYLWAAFVLVE